jgi:hypothetical protein
VNELQTLLDSCTVDESMELKDVVVLLQRVLPNKEQSERLYRFLRMRYGSQFHTLNSTTVNYLVSKKKHHLLF